MSKRYLVRGVVIACLCMSSIFYITDITEAKKLSDTLRELKKKKTKDPDTSTKPETLSKSSGIIPCFIKGSVTDTDNEKPLNKVKLTLNIDNNTDMVTPESGAFVIQVPAGEYTLLISKDGYENVSIDVKVDASNAETVDIKMKKVRGVEDADEGDVKSKPERKKRKIKH